MNPKVLSFTHSSECAYHALTLYQVGSLFWKESTQPWSLPSESYEETGFDPMSTQINAHAQV